MRPAVRRSAVAVISALTSLASVLAAVPAAGEPEATPGQGEPGGRAARITLITGDVVEVTPAGSGRSAATVRPGAGRERMRFHTFELDGGLRVLPEDVVGQVGAGVLDPDLFDVEELLADGYGAAESLPLIVQYAGGARSATALAGTAVRALPSIGGAAVRADKDELSALWRSVGGANGSALSGGIAKIWLDGRVRPVLDRSVAQIGAPSAWQAGYDGTGIDVAVLDTGIDGNHPDVAGQVEATQNFSDSPDAVDHFGHGTHVAATVAGTGAGSGGQRKGVAPGADLLIGKVLNDDGIGYDSWIIAGMEWAAASGAEVVNMSLGGGATDGTDPLSQAVNRITADTGTLFVVSAGNDGELGEQTVGTPGAADAALTVGAVDRDESLAVFSSRGPRVGDHAIKPDVTAPGVGIVAARAAGTAMGTPVDDRYTAASGTSMAAPHVAGAAALLAQQHPDLDAQALKDLIASTTRHNPALQVYEQGTGRVDVARAVSQPVFGTGNLGFGALAIPDARPTTRQLTYTNTGSTPLTLDLTVQVTNLENGQPDPDGFSVGSNQVTVPAGESVAVPVTLDPASLERGRHGGWVVATGPDGVSTRTAVSATLRGRMHEVTFRMRDRAGELTSTPLIALFGDSREAVYMGHIFPWANETGVTFQVEEGSYLLHALGADGAPLDEQSTLITDPEFNVTGDISLDLDMRTGTPIRIETPKPSEQQSVLSYYVQRTHANGRRILAGVMEFSTTQQVNVTPTRTPSVGSYEFSSRWQLVAPMVQTAVQGVSGPLDINLLHTSPAWDGRRRFDLVTAGRGTPDELAAADVRGKAVLLTPSTEVSEEDQVAAAAAAGAATVLIQRPADWSAWTVWRPVGDRLPVPAMVVAYDDALRLLARVRSGRTSIDITLTTSSPYLYDVFHVERGRVPDKIVHKVTTQNTAQLEVRYGHTGGFDWAKEQRFGWRPWQEYSWNDAQRMIETPKVREEWISSNDSLWQQHAAYFYTWNDMGPVFGATHPPRTYQPGRAGTESWFTPVVRPATSALPGSPVSTRTGDQLALRVPEFVDSSGHYQRTIDWEDTASARLYRDGTLLQELPSAWQNVSVGAGDAAYRLELDAERRTSDDWLWGTRSTTAWEFRSRRAAGTTLLPLLQVDYAVPADLEGRVLGRVPHLLGLTVRQQPGLPAPQGVQVRADVSFDDGATWRQVPVLGHGAKVVAVVPSGKGAVTLRVRAQDKAGNKVDQTVVRAYGLR